MTAYELYELLGCMIHEDQCYNHEIGIAMGEFDSQYISKLKDIIRYESRTDNEKRIVLIGE